MRVLECVIVSCVFMMNPSHFSTCTTQQQNQMALSGRNAFPVRVAEPCSQAHNVSEAQRGPNGMKRFPGGKTPLDPLSVRLRINGSQKRRPGAGSLDRITTRQSNSIKSEDNSPDLTEKRGNNQQRLESATSSERIATTEKNPSDRVKIRFSKDSASAGFGIPIYRIGLGRVPKRS